MVSKMRGLEILFAIAFVSSALCSELEECSPIRRRKCRHAILEELDNQKRALSTHELEFHCGTLRDNLECLIWQLSECSSPDAQEGNSDVVWRAWKYMKIVCDTFGNWWQKACFTSGEARKCETHLYIGDMRNKNSTCADYEEFRDCIIDVLEGKCSDEESGFFGSYLLDRAGSMVWTCPKPDDNALDVEGSHLLAYRSSPLTGDSPFVTGCNARATEEMRGCLDRHQYERDQSLGAKDGEDRLRKTCCATWNYRRCVQNAVRTHCYDSREVDIQAANDVIPHDRDFLCREHWIYTCSDAVGSRAMAGLVAAALAVRLLLR